MLLDFTISKGKKEWEVLVPNLVKVLTLIVTFPIIKFLQMTVYRQLQLEYYLDFFKKIYLYHQSPFMVALIALHILGVHSIT